MWKISYTLLNLLLTLVIITSCTKRKEEKCGSKIYFEVPTHFPEGEDLTISFSNLSEKFPYTYYSFRPVDDEGLTLWGGLKSYHQTGDEVITYEVDNFSVLDTGRYTLIVEQTSKNCESFSIHRNVQLIPMRCPCKDDLNENTLYSSNIPNDPDPSFAEYSPYLYQNELEDEFGISMMDGLFGPFTAELEFYIPIPEKSSTYLGLDGYYASAINFDYDPRIYCDLTYTESGYPIDKFRIENKKHKIYVERDENVLMISFCDAKFTSTSGLERYVSTTIRLNL